MKSISRMWHSTRLSGAELFRDNSGIAATEFAVIVPIMLVMFFGTVEFSSGVAVDRKVTLVARTLSDLTSQSTSVATTDMANFFAASASILTPYSSTPAKAAISELYVNPTTLKATVQWSQGYQGGTARTVGTAVTIPSALAVGGTYLIFSEVSYLYTPAVGYVMAKAGLTLSDVSYTRPRQSTCVYFSPATACTTH
jgi:Flp pilus assembly protein TadG